MLKLFIVRKDGYEEQVHHKQPRRYMCGYSFNQIMKYAKEELYWQDIEQEDVVCFIIRNEDGFWEQAIRRGGDE